MFPWPVAPPPASSSSSLRRLSLNPARPNGPQQHTSTYSMTAGPCPHPQPPGHPRAHSTPGTGPSLLHHPLPITTVGAVQLRQVLHFREAPRCTLSCHLLGLLLVGWLCLTRPHPHQPLHHKLLLISCEPSRIYSSLRPLAF